MARPTNQELAERFRNLLTNGASGSFDSVAKQLSLRHISGVDTELLLELTKPWRGEMWKLFSEIEDRLDPLRVERRNKRDG